MFYTILSCLTQPLVWLQPLLRSCKTPAYHRHWTGRYGFCQNEIEPDGILLHSISIGETLVAVPLVHALRHRYSSMPVTVIITASTGSERAMSAFDKDVHRVYLLYDLPGTINRFLSTIQPKLIIVVGTELWPNAVTALHRCKILLTIANARLPKCSAKGYVKLGGFMRRLLSRVTLTVTQNEEGDNRFLALELKCNQLAVIGSLKFDISATPELTTHTTTLRCQWVSHHRARIATSIHDGEEQITLQMHKGLPEALPSLLLILVPRRSECFPDACEIVRKAGMSFTLRSTGKVPSSSTQVVVGDTMGKLMLFYGIVDLVFAGDSLAKCGDCNPLEPVVHVIPVLMGPHTLSFKDICAKLQQDDGLITVTDADSLAREVSMLLADEGYRPWCGRYTMRVLHQDQGTLSRPLKLL